MKPFSSAQSGENIAKERDIVASRWDIEHIKIHLLIHDTGAKMVKDVLLAKYNSASCFIFTFQRAISESLKIQAKVTTLIATGRRFVQRRLVGVGWSNLSLY